MTIRRSARRIGRKIRDKTLEADIDKGNQVRTAGLSGDEVQDNVGCSGYLCWTYS